MNSGLRCRETAVRRPTRRVKELVLIREQAGRCSSFDIGTSARSFTREAKVTLYLGLGGEGKVHVDIVSQELQTQTGVGIEWNGERRGSSRVIVPTKRDPQRSHPRHSARADEWINKQYEELKTYQGCSHLRVGLGLALTGLRRQTCLISISQLKRRCLSVPALQWWTSACPNKSDT